jgi:hypothetical protein
MMVKSIEARPAFVEYQNRCMQRPAFARTREQSAKFIDKLKSGG